eukprot:IDg2636t1
MNDSLVTKFGLAINEREQKTGTVVSARCLFCEKLGREADDHTGRKRKRTMNVKTFKRPFRSDNIKAHLTGQHSKAYIEYSALSDEEKKVYFNRVNFNNTLAAHFDGEQSLTFTINRDIVDVIIGDMMFNPDDEESAPTRERALQIFKLFPDANGDGDDGEQDLNREAYKVEIKSSRLFHLVVGFVACGTSFRMATRLVSTTKAVSHMSCFGGCSEGRAASFVRVVCAASLQKISELLRCQWAFSIAVDVGTKQGTSYLDFRVRFEHGAKVHNFHLLAIPLFHRKTADIIFTASSKLLDVIAPKWKTQLVGVSTDGERTMTGRLSGVATRIQEVADDGVVRVWCALHQLDLVVQAEYLHLHDDRFVHALGIHEEAVSLPAEKSRYRLRLPRCEEAGVYSSTFLVVQLLALDAVATEITSVVRRLQGLSTLLNQQKAQLEGLVQSLMSLCPVQGPHNAEAMAEIDGDNNAIRGSFSVSHSNARSFVEDQGSFVMGVMQALPVEDTDCIDRSIAGLIAGLVDGTLGIVAQRDRNNHSSEDELPVVLPHDLCHQRTASISTVIRRHKSRLESAGWNSQAIEEIENDHRAMLRAYREEPPFKAAVDNCSDARTDFDAGWVHCGLSSQHFKSSVAD